MASAVTVTVKVAGENLVEKLKLQLIEFDSCYECHTIPEATLTVDAGDTGSAEFKLVDNDKVAPGKPIEVLLRYEGDNSKEATVFAGVISGQNLKISQKGGRLVLKCHSDLIKLVEPRLTQKFPEEKTDKDIITTLLTPAGLTEAKVADTKAKHSQMILFDDHAWSFIKYRTEANGLMLVPGVKGVNIAAPDDLGKKVHKLKMDQFIDLDLAIDDTSALDTSKVKTSSWDIEKQAAQPAKPGKVPKIAGGPHTADKAAEAMGRKGTDWLPVSENALAPEELEGWSHGELLYRELDRYQGLLTLQGTGDIVPGDKVELSDMSKQFSKGYLVTGVRQKVTANGWQTIIRFGLPITRTGFFHGLHKQNAPMKGLVTGVVEDYAKKEKKDLYRIQVKVPMLGAKENIIWARLATPYASKESGLFVPPKPKDEVVLGFFGNSGSEPVVLGSMHNPVNKPPVVYAKENKMTRGLVMVKDELTLLFDDAEAGKPKLDIVVGKEQSINLSGENGMALAQKTVGMKTKEALTIESEADITLKAGGKVTLEPGADAEIKAGGKCAITASKTEIQ